jgi:GTP-binding protein
MPLPIVAIVGRPNVGKSSLLNCLARRRIAIVDPTPGVTRDRVSAVVEHESRWFEAVDTGGMGLEDDAFAADVARQIGYAVQEAAVIVLVTDVRDGLMPLDQTAAQRLRRVRVPVLVAANKADTDRLGAGAAEFYSLGYEPVLAVSAKHSRGRRDLLEAIAGYLPREAREAPAQVAMKLAVVGKRNCGKSTFINALAREERVIVSEVPGTTRDAVDIRFEKDGLVYLAIDTAGVRKRKSLSGDVEFYGLARALASIARADVVLFLLDAAVPVSRVDMKLGTAIQGRMKPVVLVVNKWDLAKGRASTDQYADYLTKALPGLAHAPLAFTSAKDSRNVASVIDLARSLYKQSTTRVGTSRLNACLREAIEARHPPSPGTRPPKIYFAAQVAVQPPTILMSVNDPALFREDYRRYLEHHFHESLDFPEVPIRLIFRMHHEDRERADRRARRRGSKPAGR